MRDHGVGLKPGEEKLVFNRFWRADPSRARQTGGTGLGLSISLEDARLHGGWLEAWGAPGQGAQFRLTLPCPCCVVLDSRTSNAMVTLVTPASSESGRRTAGDVPPLPPGSVRPRPLFQTVVVLPLTIAAWLLFPERSLTTVPEVSSKG